jgi:hypothetical protein
MRIKFKELNRVRVYTPLILAYVRGHVVVSCIDLLKAAAFAQCPARFLWYLRC